MRVERMVDDPASIHHGLRHGPALRDQLSKLLVPDGGAVAISIMPVTVLFPTVRGASVVRVRCVTIDVLDRTEILRDTPVRVAEGIIPTGVIS
jgi:hypothetical protein